MKEDNRMKFMDEAEAVVIGAGSGLSTAAGLSYDGDRFKDNFGDFIEKYGMTDMYSAGFYPFQSREEKWAYWSRHIHVNRYAQPAGQAYDDLFEWSREKNYFVVTTNVDHQFWLAGFPDEKIFAVQGDYGYFQCASACHKTLYDNEVQVREMVCRQKDCRIPGELVPRCPVCGGDMEVNLRRDDMFVEDEHWHEAKDRYVKFLAENKGKKIVFLELGVGMNTPAIIKYPFWQMTGHWENAAYVCVNKGQAFVPPEIREKSVCLDMDISEFLSGLRQLR